jgi:hypothetical protein
MNTTTKICRSETQQKQVIVCIPRDDGGKKSREIEEDNPKGMMTKFDNDPSHKAITRQRCRKCSVEK